MVAAFALTREAGPKTRWFTATDTAAMSPCIKVQISTLYIIVITVS